MSETATPAKPPKGTPTASAPDESKAVVVAAEHGTQIAKADQHTQRFRTVDLDSAADLPDLDAAQELPIDLMSSYWTPENAGDSKNLYFSHVDDSQLIDPETGEVKTLRTAFFYERKADEIKAIRNASKRLVGAIESNNIQRGTPLRVTYLGKKKNVNNSFKSDDWAVKPLLLPVK
jgi:hypothetical protein